LHCCRAGALSGRLRPRASWGETRRRPGERALSTGAAALSTRAATSRRCRVTKPWIPRRSAWRQTCPLRLP